MPDLSEVMAAERERLNKAIADADAKIMALNIEANGYKIELKAIDAYEAVKSGKPTRDITGARSARGSKQEMLLALLAGSTDGMSRAQILEAVGAKGDTKSEGSISNALTNMKKAGKIGLANGRYTAS